MFNPFVELWANPLTTLAAAAYVCLLLAVSVALAGAMWSTVLWLRNAWEYRHKPDHFGPEWELAPPVGVYGRVAALLFLTAVELFLFGGIVYMLSG